jgi:hexosaminidase
VDAQSWPLEISGMPQLTTNGAYSTDKVYSLADTKDLISYANARGIDVIIEFDTVSCVDCSS